VQTNFFFLLLLVGFVFGLPHLRELASRKGLMIGAAANYYVLHSGEANYSVTLGQQFDIVVAENAMKWAATEPNRNQFSYDQGDEIVNFAHAHGQTIRGHNLCWGSYNPSWLENGHFSADELKQILSNHIQNVVGHWKGLYCWDVVNEAVSDNPNGGNNLKPNVWFNGIGASYLDIAFQAAHQADPNAKLFYNDYGGEGMGAKSNAIYDMVKSMKQRGIPIHGVGLQMHVADSYYPNPSDVAQNIARLGALGLEVHITEMDVKADGGSDKLIKQAQIFSDMLKVCLGASNCKAFLSWGFTDKHTWLGSNQEPLEFDVNYSPKPCFYSMVTALQ